MTGAVPMSSDDHEWSEDELKLVLKYFGRHLIALVLAYKCRKEDSALEEQTRFACLTAFVITVGQQWYLVTAGHNIEDWKPATQDDRPTKIVAASLADYFGTNPHRMMPLPYNLFKQAYYHAYLPSQDIDYAIVFIDEALREALVGNGILPLPINETRSNYDDFYGFGIVGFPAELCGPYQPDDPSCMAAGAQPVLVPIQRVALPTPPNRPPAFIADVIEMGNQESVVGMSGGPIFGYRMGSDNHSQYEVIAIQSQWNGTDRIIACPVTFALEEIRAAIRADQELDD